MMNSGAGRNYKNMFKLQETHIIKKHWNDDLKAAHKKITNNKTSSLFNPIMRNSLSIFSA